MKGKALQAKGKADMQLPYVEQDCTFKYEGGSFTSGGAVITEDYAIGYPAEDGIMSNWHGEQIGTYKFISSWKLYNSWVSDRMYQIEATINGVVYTGRGCGVSMIWKGKRKAVKSRR